VSPSRAARPRRSLYRADRPRADGGARGVSLSQPGLTTSISSASRGGGAARGEREMVIRASSVSRRISRWPLGPLPSSLRDRMNASLARLEPPRRGEEGGRRPFEARHVSSSPTRCAPTRSAAAETRLAPRDRTRWRLRSEVHLVDFAASWTNPRQRPSHERYPWSGRSATGENPAKRAPCGGSSDRGYETAGSSATPSSPAPMDRLEASTSGIRTRLAPRIAAPPIAAARLLRAAVSERGSVSAGPEWWAGRFLFSPVRPPRRDSSIST